jgi:MinD-like ATPase involved in chromosome partitioning or flagellar assembly
MVVVAVASLRGSPGATSLALDLARLAGSTSLLIEADPDGGCLAARLGLAARPGVTELAGAARTGIDPADLARFAQTSLHGVTVIVSHPAAEQVQAALRAAGAHVAAALRAVDGAVVVDVGRLRPGSPSLVLAEMAHAAVIVSPNSVDAIAAVVHRREILSRLPDVHLVLDSATPYRPSEIAANIGWPVWGVIPQARDRRSARRRHRALFTLADAIGVAHAAQSPRPLLSMTRAEP